MNTFRKISTFLSRCYYELVHMYWPSIYDLQLYCIVVIFFILFLCTLTVFIDIAVKYLLYYFYN